jgi:hypothetical protein
MKITKQRLREIIKEEIQDFQEEQNLRKQIREISGVGRIGGAKTKGYKSPTTKTKQSSYDTKKTDTATKLSTKTTNAADYTTKDTALTDFAGSKFRRYGGGTWHYRSSAGSGFTLNPDWTTKANAKAAALTAKNSADSAYDTAASDETSALSDLETSQAADLQTTIATSPPAGVGAGAGFGKGKAAGTGKGKGGKKGKKKKN